MATFFKYTAHRKPKLKQFKTGKNIFAEFVPPK